MNGQIFGHHYLVFTIQRAVPSPVAHSVVFAHLRTGHWFDPWLSQYSFPGLMIVIATGFIPLSTLSVGLTMVMWESSQWLGKNIVRRTDLPFTK